MRNAGLLSAVAVLAIAGEASAALPTYHEDSSAIPPNQTSLQRSGCPAGRSDIVGGGVFLTGSSLEVEVKSSAPIDDTPDKDRNPDDYWVGQGNVGPSQETLTTTSICSKAPVRYRRAAKLVEADGVERVATAECPDGRLAISGGVDVTTTPSTEVRLMASVPVGQRKWRGRVVNGSADEVRMKVWAICADVAIRSTRAFDPTLSFLNNTQDSLTTPNCSRAKYAVTGVGAAVIGTPPGTEVASLIPDDLGDDGDTPDDAATAWFNNQSGADQRMSVTAVCAKL